MVDRTCCSKADQSAKPDNDTVNGYCISVAVSRANKMEECDISVDFSKSGHICDWL